MKCSGLPTETIKKFGHVYVTSMPTESKTLDKLCEWAREEIDRNHANSKNCLYLLYCMHSYVYICIYVTESWKMVPNRT